MISFSYSGDGRGDEHGNELRPTLRPEAREAHAHPVMRDVYARYDPLRLLSPLDQTSPTLSDLTELRFEAMTRGAPCFYSYREYLCNDRHGRKKRKKTEGEPVYLVSWSRASVKVICRFISFRMDVSLLGRWRNVCEPFRNREYDVLVGTMLASFHFVELLLTRWS